MFAASKGNIEDRRCLYREYPVTQTRIVTNDQRKLGIEIDVYQRFDAAILVGQILSVIFLIVSALQIALIFSGKEELLMMRTLGFVLALCHGVFFTVTSIIVF